MKQRKTISVDISISTVALMQENALQDSVCIEKFNKSISAHTPAQSVCAYNVYTTAKVSGCCDWKVCPIKVNMSYMYHAYIITAILTRCCDWRVGPIKVNMGYMYRAYIIIITTTIWSLYRKTVCGLLFPIEGLLQNPGILWMWLLMLCMVGPVTAMPLFFLIPMHFRFYWIQALCWDSNHNIFGRTL